MTHEQQMEAVRPGYNEIREELRAANPQWGLSKLSCETKNLWHRRNPSPPTRGQAGAA